MTSPPDQHSERWRDPSVAVADRVAQLMAEMTLQEKVAQLYGVWVGADSSGAGVAPHQHDMAGLPVAWDELIRSGLGQLTRPFGTAPVDPEMGARGVAATQRDIVAGSRLGIPALVHEECLTGLAAWQATVFPAPLSWGASFDPVLVERMGAAIGATMASLGVHQGLAPVLDVTRDLRWGRVEETIGEDPHLVGTIGSAYVRGVESSGVIATLKHFVGYSASRAGRNLAPVSAGPRELADVLLPPFEMALRSGGARSVMNSYSDVDGVPVAADATLLTDLLRGTWGFEGTVVADYFSVAFLETLHGVAGDKADAARQALAAGIDVELPTVACFGEPLVKAVESGEVDVALVDRALERVLRQKCELGLLDAGWDATPPVLRTGGPVELDPASSRALAREVAERAVVLLANDGTLPLAPQAKVALVGPQAATTHGYMGCYSFPLHVGAQHPDVEMGLQVDTLVDAFRALGRDVVHAQGCPVLGGEDDDIAAAARVAAEADVCVLALGDLAGLFGRGTSGEGCDVADLALPGRQGELLEAVLATGTPVVLLLMVGRPYDLSPYVDRLAAVVCGFFLGEQGGPVLADVLTGRLEAAGRLPVGFPGAGGSQPATYLAAPLGHRNEVSSIDPGALFPFGHGLSYGSTSWSEATAVSGEVWPTDGRCEVHVTVRNTGDRATTDVVQLYLHDPVAEVARPVQSLIAAQRVDLAVGEEKTVAFRLHADLTSYTGRAGQRIVEPGGVELRAAASSTDVRSSVDLRLAGERRVVGHDRELHPDVQVR